ncbi:MAG: flagellar basal-body MS-ring/collar protein FliF, partial [Candidatus Saccharibacteria bacterium]
MGFADALKERWNQLTEYWAGLSLNQKVLIAAAVLLIIAAITIPSVTMMQPDYVILYNKLEVNDAAAMTAKLDELAIPYQLSDNGSTIMVPSAQKDTARLQLASAGLPKGVAGFDLFNTTNFGETETDKKVKYQVALQGELTKTIQSLNQVEYAKVNLAIPEDSLFTENQKNPTASVLVKTKPYMELTPKEVQGIIHLVASSVQGLKAEDVTVVDTNGTVLSDNVGDDQGSTVATSLTQTQIQMKRKFEKDMQNSVQSMLESILGSGKAVVRVSAELNFDQKQSHKETWGPNSFVRSEKLDDESSTKAESGTEGVPGTQSNIPTYQTGGTTGGTESSEKSSKTRNYEIDNEVVDQKYAMGDVKRLTISVIVDKDLNAQSKQQIQDAVASASGFKQERGD